MIIIPAAYLVRAVMAHSPLRPYPHYTSPARRVARFHSHSRQAGQERFQEGDHPAVPPHMCQYIHICLILDPGLSQ